MTAGGKAAAVGTTGKTGIRGSTSVASARRLPAVSFPSVKRRSAACFPAGQRLAARVRTTARSLSCVSSSSSSSSAAGMKSSTARRPPVG